LIHIYNACVDNVPAFIAGEPYPSKMIVLVAVAVETPAADTGKPPPRINELLGITVAALVTNKADSGAPGAA
jgi:hypothetical protein